MRCGRSQHQSGIIASLEQVCRNARAAEAGELGEFTVAFMMHAAHSSLPPLARRFTEAYPGVILRLRQALPPELVAGLLDGRFDAAIGFATVDLLRLGSVPLFGEPLRAALPADHPLCGEEVVTPAQFARLPLIFSPAEVTPSLRKAINRRIAQHGPLAIRVETRLQQTIVCLVAEGAGAHWFRVRLIAGVSPAWHSGRSRIRLSSANCSFGRELRQSCASALARSGENGIAGRLSR